MSDVMVWALIGMGLIVSLALIGTALALMLLRVDVASFDLVKHLERQQEFSSIAFGPGARSQGIIDHIGKELKDIAANPDDVTEWVDVVLLALDGAWRAGHSPAEICAAIEAKQTRNEGRTGALPT